MKKGVHLAVLNQARGTVSPDVACVQFVVNNPTAFVVKIGFGLVETGAYEFIIKAQSMFVSPFAYFTELGYIVDAITPARVLPTIYCYTRWIGTPGSTVLS